MISVNGESRALPDPATVGALLDDLGLEAGRRGIAVAVDAEVVPRTTWDAHELRDGDQVEVLTAIQGG
ncbi:MAG: sulfur carrier protein ThiS [Solirubrobacteraceae bacterium]|nr:sulfur carrier protein ThiS [Solirubrobacteraceae bacterium]